MKLSFLFLFFMGLLCRLLASPVIQTGNGFVQGNTLTFEGKQVNSFLGIPYAEPPVGPLRFKPPQPAKSWTGIYNASEHGSACCQPPNSFLNLSKSSEDCLYLNIWTPGSSVKEDLKPVMVWIYGGGFSSGSADLPLNDGRVFVAFTNTIFVSFNYRLGPLGFLNSQSQDAPGNVGILDQNLALRWISKNIKAFGGDPEMITIFGQSAGSLSVNMHLMSPLSRGLFKRAIMESGSLHTTKFIQSPEVSLERSNLLSRKLGCADDIKDLYSNPSDVVQCLRNKSASDIIAVVKQTFPEELIPFLPTYGDKVLQIDPILASKRGIFQNGDILIGTTTDEGSIYFVLTMDSKFLEPSLANFTTAAVMEAFKAVVKSLSPEEFSHFETFYLTRPEYQGKDGIRKAASDFLGDILFVCPTVFFSERYADRSNDVYMYQFSHRSELEPRPQWVGTQHSDEVYYVFGYPFVEKTKYTEEDRTFSLKMMKAWTSFAKSGKPTPGDFQWPPFNRSFTNCANLNANNMEVSGTPRKDFCDYWRNVF